MDQNVESILQSINRFLIQNHRTPCIFRFKEELFKGNHAIFTQKKPKKTFKKDQKILKKWVKMGKNGEKWGYSTE